MTWISTKTQLPTPEKEVLVYIRYSEPFFYGKEGSIIIDKIRSSFNDFLSNRNGLGKVVAWQELPNIPDEI